MEIRRFLNDNVAQSNCYVISYENDCYIVDPGEEKMTQVIGSHSRNPFCIGV